MLQRLTLMSESYPRSSKVDTQEGAGRLKMNGHAVSLSGTEPTWHAIMLSKLIYRPGLGTGTKLFVAKTAQRARLPSTGALAFCARLLPRVLS